MDRISIEELLKIVRQQNKNVLFLDTCCLLDIIRCVQRENIDILKTALKIIEDFSRDRNEYLIILPSVVGKEWGDNHEVVRKETNKYIKKYEKQYSTLVKCFNLIFSKSMQSEKLVQYSIGSLLDNFSKSVLDVGLSFNSIEECIVKAWERVVNSIAPAKKGKDSLKDCTIFEEILYISRSLRENRFPGKIVFATSNTHEYFDNSEIIPSIQTELEISSIEIATSLNQGYYLVSNK